MAKAREITGLDCGAEAGEGVRLVLASRLDEMCAFREAALGFDDPEGVHDMRVASRRLRSALRDFSPHLLRKRRKLGRALVEVKSLADALGEVRDEDVAIAELEKLAAEAPADVAPGVKELADERRLKRDRARSRLEAALTEEGLGKLSARFIEALDDALKISSRKPGATGKKASAENVSFRQTGRDIITARFVELSDLSASLTRPFKTRPLHRMRIAAKRLRYAIELFSICWSEPTEPFAKEIARLQTSLGELHDCDLWIEELGKSLRDAAVAPDGPSTGRKTEDPAATRKRLAALWLLDHFVQKRTLHFHDALSRWHEWEMTGFQTRLAEILNS